MSETLVTVTGNVATRPEMRITASGAQVTRFRLAATERRFDRATERWADGHTNFFTVWAWRALGENVAASVAIGEPVVVQGRLRVSEREDKGQTYVTAGIDAAVVGHDLGRGTSAFRRAAKVRDTRPDPFAIPAPEPTPATPATTPEPAPTATTPPQPTPDKPPFAAPAPAAATQPPARSRRSAQRQPDLVPS